MKPVIICTTNETSIYFLGFPNFYNKQCAKSHIALWRIFDSVVRVRYILLECILLYSLATDPENELLNGLPGGGVGGVGVDSGDDSDEVKEGGDIIIDQVWPLAQFHYVCFL